MRRPGTDEVLVRFDWDSGPYGVEYTGPPGEPYVAPSSRVGYADICGCSLPVPREVWERHLEAHEAAEAAREALYDAARAARDVLLAEGS